MSSSIEVFRKNNKDSLRGSIFITGSKSISNRLLILKYLYKNEIFIKNISNSEDTFLLEKNLNSDNSILDIHHAGTAMRFLTSYLSIQNKKTFILTGSKRMKERPIKILVDSLKKLGANIIYLEKDGYPPIKIFGKNILGGEINMNAEISSQYISSIMLVASKFKKGLKIILHNNVTSYPYIKMTSNLLILSGINVFWNGKKKVSILPGKEKGNKTFYVESDWSSASYYYSIAASYPKKVNLVLSSYQKKSLQGDKEVVNIYEKYFGVSTSFLENGKKILLKKKINFFYKKFFELNLNKYPDLAQTIAVTCAVLKIRCKLNGLETLKIKETDRLLALKNELLKFGVITSITDSCFKITEFINPNNRYFHINTYQDHRMAMSFIPFSFFYSSIQIESPNVVKKSYPFFWKDIQSIGFLIKKKK